MTLIELVRTIDGAEKALAERGLEHRGVRYVYGMLVRQPWTFNERIISNDEARIIVHGLAVPLLACPGCVLDTTYDERPGERELLFSDWEAFIPDTVPKEDWITAACLALIVAAGKEKK